MITPIDETIKVFTLHGWNVAQSGSDYAVFERPREYVPFFGFAKRIDATTVSGWARATLESDGKVRLKLERAITAPSYVIGTFKKAAKQLHRAGVARKWP